jgi:hypothetical protein
MSRMRPASSGHFEMGSELVPPMTSRVFLAGVGAGPAPPEGRVKARFRSG